MNIAIRPPNITAPTPEGQMQQMQSYMYQLAEQLNWALNVVESAQSGSTSAAVKYQQSAPITQKEAEETFNSIKGLIIKSADIVKAYEDTIRTNFKGEYFADSDFGTFVEETNSFVEVNSRGVTEAYERIETITNKDGTGILDETKKYVDETKGYIQRGILSDGSIGVEVGETINGSYHRYARFTAERLTFFDINGNPVAYIGAGDTDKEDANCLYVTGKAVFLGEIQLGRYKTDSSDGLAFTWIGG